MTLPQLLLSVITLMVSHAFAQTPSLVPPSASTPLPVTAPTRDAEVAAPHAGIVKTLRGEVTLINTAGVSRRAQAGEALRVTERIATGPDSAASVVLRDGTTLVVGASSRLELKSFSFDSTTHQGGLLLSLLQGSTRMITGLLGKAHPEAVRIETTTAVVGVRGTDFIVQADEQP